MRFNRNNQTYRMLINVCWLIAKGLLQTQEDGSTKLMDFLDEQRMSRLYERFILEYFKREHPSYMLALLTSAGRLTTTSTICCLS